MATRAVVVRAKNISKSKWLEIHEANKTVRKITRDSRLIAKSIFQSVDKTAIVNKERIKCKLGINTTIMLIQAILFQD
jgi:hypothetical protein